MANNNTANVSAGKPKVSGAIFRAPIGTTLPTTAVAALDEAFVNLGFVSEDGVTNSDKNSAKVIKDWSGVTVATINEGKEDSFKFKLLEVMNVEAKKLTYGDANVSGTLSTGITVKSNAADPDEYVYVIDMELNGGYAHRIVIPKGTVTEVGDKEYKSGDLIAYDITLSAVQDASGNTHYEYTAPIPQTT